MKRNRGNSGACCLAQLTDHSSATARSSFFRTLCVTAHTQKTCCACTWHARFCQTTEPTATATAGIACKIHFWLRTNELNRSSMRNSMRTSLTLQKLAPRGELAPHRSYECVLKGCHVEMKGHKADKTPGHAMNPV